MPFDINWDLSFIFTVFVFSEKKNILSSLELVSWGGGLVSILDYLLYMFQISKCCFSRAIFLKKRKTTKEKNYKIMVSIELFRSGFFTEN